MIIKLLLFLRKNVLYFTAMKIKIQEEEKREKRKKKKKKREREEKRRERAHDCRKPSALLVDWRGFRRRICSAAGVSKIA